MKIDELINILKKYKEQYGNLTVTIETFDEYSGMSSGAQSIQNIERFTAVTQPFIYEDCLNLKSY